MMAMTVDADVRIGVAVLVLASGVQVGGLAIQ